MYDDNALASLDLDTLFAMLESEVNTAQAILAGKTEVEARAAFPMPAVIQHEALQRPAPMANLTGTPYDMINAAYTLPFQGYPFQQKVVNERCLGLTNGLYLDVGTGKTYTSVMVALYQFLTNQVDQYVVTMPPILLRGWKKFLDTVPQIKAVIYAGTPAQRAQIQLTADFVLMSTAIFKRDFNHISKTFRKRRVGVIVDEATSVKNIETGNHKKLLEFLGGERPVQLLTGTPLSTPADAYAYVRLVAPGTYRNQTHFNQVHVEERDFYDKVTKWRHLDIMAEAMATNSSQVLKRDVLHELPPITMTQMPYDLSPAHMKLYRKLAEEQLIEYENGGKFDATEASRLAQAIQQIVVNWGFFAQDESLVAAGEEMIAEVLEQLAGKKLIVFGQYRMTNRRLTANFAKQYGAVSVYGENTAKQNDRNVDRFKSDPDCRLIVMQPSSGGVGLDGLQHVCSDTLFIEAPSLSRHFTQAVGRTERVGAKHAINVRIAIAQGTIQVNRFRNLLDNDALVDQVQPTFKQLREHIFGG